MKELRLGQLNLFSLLKIRGGEKVQCKVIVDIPLMQTDKPYDYAVPENFLY